MNPLRWNFRLQMLAGTAVCAALLAFAVYLQLRMGLEPCPLCIFQRIAFAAMGVIFLVAALHGPSNRAGRLTYAVLAALAGVVGAGIAARHVWVQSQPQDVMSSCGPPLAFLSETMGPFEVFRTVLTGTANCGVIDWTLLGMSMPMWCLVWFVLLSAWALLCGAARVARRYK